MSERVHTAGMVDYRALVEAHAKDAGLSVWGLFAQAGVAWETWRRWRSGENEPNLATIRKLLAVPTTTGIPARSAQ